MRTLYYEDIEVDVHMESPWVTVSAEEIVSFAEVWDPHPFLTHESPPSHTGPHIFIMQFATVEAIPLSNATIFGGALANILLRRGRRAPQTRASATRRRTDRSSTGTLPRPGGQADSLTHGHTPRPTHVRNRHDHTH